MPMNLILNVPRRNASTPQNTVAPAINPVAVIGTQIAGDDGTWTGAPTFTYQWQRNAGTWGNIALATAKNYTPVDADFGYQLRLVVTPSAGTAANSNATNLTREAPAQTLGPAELLTNGTFAAWTDAHTPTGWSVTTGGGPDPELTQVDSGQAHGGTNIVGGSANFYSSGNTGRPLISQVTRTIGNYYQTGLTISAGATSLDVGNISGAFNSVGSKLQIFRAPATAFNIAPTNNGNMTIDDVTDKLLTTNVQLVAPSANMRLDQFYSLPASPVEGSQVWVLPRVSDFSAGNYWLISLRYSGSQWNINLYSVATHTRTSRIAAANIGATNGVRINANGDSLSLYTTANGGTLWTQRGTTITNSTYNTAVGVNALWTSDFTIGNLVYAPAD